MDQGARQGYREQMQKYAKIHVKIKKDIDSNKKLLYSEYTRVNIGKGMPRLDVIGYLVKRELLLPLLKG